MNLNSVSIIGRITKEIELKKLPNGNSVVRLSVATNRTWKQEGQKKEEVEFHSVVAFGKLADIIGQYVTKGQLIYIQGRLKTSSWESDGAKKYRTEIIAENMQMGPKSQGQDNKKQDAKDEGYGAYDQDEGEETKEVESNLETEDIPF